ncbi:MAG: hypothetical protein ACRDUW_10880 [Pseudonocardiaceae bacterium]
MTQPIGAGTSPGPLLCLTCGDREATLIIVTMADREADYLCWPCLLGLAYTIAQQSMGEQVADTEPTDTTASP